MKGKLNPLVIFSAQLLRRNTTIKLNLPFNFDIPVKLGMSDIFKIKQTNIVRSNDVIMFINTIPMIFSS